jgi:stage V sporulation protein G
MQISEIRIKLVENRSDRLKAFCSVTFDNQFVIRDLKIIEGSDGFFVAMPSRKLTDRCPKCGSKNHLRAKFCNECGARLPEEKNRRRGPRTKLHADIAHPINTETREYIQKEILDSFNQEWDLSQQPGYQPHRMDADEDYYDSMEPSGQSAPPPPTTPESPPEESTADTAPAETPPPMEPEPEPEKPKEESSFGEGIL